MTLNHKRNVNPIERKSRNACKILMVHRHLISDNFYFSLVEECRLYIIKFSLDGIEK